MTITNKKSNPAKFDKGRHLTAHDKVRVGKEGERCGQVGQEGSAYLLRLIENPHQVEWVVFK